MQLNNIGHAHACHGNAHSLLSIFDNVESISSMRIFSSCMRARYRSAEAQGSFLRNPKLWTNVMRDTGRKRDPLFSGKTEFILPLFF